MNNITSTTQIDAHIDKFEHLLTHAQQRTIPSKQMNKYSLKLTDTILRCIHERNKLNVEIKREITIIQNNNWSRKLTKLEPQNQSLWQTRKFMKNKKRFMTPVNRPNGSLATNCTDKANALANQFFENHLNSLANNNPTFNNEVNNTINSFFNQTLNGDASYPTESEIKSYVKNTN